jgi:hypothetical protein
MIVGIEMGEYSVRFRHSNYEIHVDPKAKESPEQIMMPMFIAGHLISFADACFATFGADYDSSDFTAYLYGFQKTARHRPPGGTPYLQPVEVSTVEEMAYHVICTETGRHLHSFIGLKEEYALSVHGRRGVFGITRVDDLMRAYGGVMLGKVSLRA